MEFEIKERTKVNAKIYGQAVSLTKPTVGQIEVYQGKMKNADAGAQLAITKDWARNLGLPEKLIDEMELDHFLQVIEELSGTKKK